MPGFQAACMSRLLTSSSIDDIGGVRARCFASLACACEVGVCAVLEVREIFSTVLRGIENRRDGTLVRPCALRAAGALLTSDLLDSLTEEREQLIRAIATVSSQDEEHVKVRWNACHALSCAVKVESEVAVAALCTALQCSTNFKVCIAACKALTKLPLSRQGEADNTGHSRLSVGLNGECWSAAVATAVRLDSGQLVDQDRGALKHKVTIIPHEAVLCRCRDEVMTSELTPTILRLFDCFDRTR